MKLSCTHYGKTVSVEVPHDDVSLDEFYDLCRALTWGVGYHPDSVAELFGDPVVTPDKESHVPRT